MSYVAYLANQFLLSFLNDDYFNNVFVFFLFNKSFFSFFQSIVVIFMDAVSDNSYYSPNDRLSMSLLSEMMISGIYFGRSY
jgi:hypothetical protein